MSRTSRTNYYTNIQQIKLDYFYEKVGFHSYKTAERYLDACNWDEIEAVKKYFEKNPDNRKYYKDDNNQIGPNLKPFLAPPPTQISHRNRPQLKSKDKEKNEIKNKDEDKEKNKIKNKDEDKEKNQFDDYDYYFTYNISKFLDENNYNNNKEKDSSTYKYIINNSKGEKSFNSFLKLLKNSRGIILVFKKESSTRIKEQFGQIKGDPLNLAIIDNCCIFPVLNTSSIGKEIVQRFMIISYPTYIFCKYKDEQNIYITDKMEGGFELPFFINAILRIPLEQVKDCEDKKKKNDKKNLSNMKAILDGKIFDNKNYIAPKNKKDKKEIQNLKDMNKGNNKENKNNNEDYKINKQIKEQGIQNKKHDKKDNKNERDNLVLGDIFLGNSIDLIRYLNEKNEKNDNDNNNSNKNNNNYIQNENENEIKNNNNYIQNENENQKNNENNKKNEIDIRDSIYNLTDAQVLQKREREMRELERQQEEKEKKEEEEKKKIIEEENRLKKIKKDYETEAEIAKMILPEEPKDDNPDVCHIVFRVPDGGKNIERKFLKTDKISSLYNYVKSIGRDIFMEPDATDFDLLSIGFPPTNLESKKNSTLEQEGLFPNSMIQIREK